MLDVIGACVRKTAWPRRQLPALQRQAVRTANPVHPKHPAALATRAPTAALVQLAAGTARGPRPCRAASLLPCNAPFALPLISAVHLPLVGQRRHPRAHPGHGAPAVQGADRVSRGAIPQQRLRWATCPLSLPPRNTPVSEAHSPRLPASTALKCACLVPDITASRNHCPPTLLQARGRAVCPPLRLGPPHCQRRAGAGAQALPLPQVTACICPVVSRAGGHRGRLFCIAR